MQKKTIIGGIVFLSMVAILIAYHLSTEKQEEVIPPVFPKESPLMNVQPRTAVANDSHKDETIEEKTQEVESIPEKYILKNMPVGVSVMPPPNFHPRPKDEWQGMLIDMNLRPMCERTEQCGLGLVCREEHCLPCLRDGECEPNESCVLDHCVRTEFVGCHSRRDCDDEGFCVLTGYSADPRGKEKMKAKCLNSFGGHEDEDDTEQDPSQTGAFDDFPTANTSYMQSLMDTAKAACPDCRKGGFWEN